MDRREALKAAAIATPIIATLPCGAAIANSSSHNCVLPAQKLTEMGGVTKISPSEDQWLRVQAYKRVCKDGDYYRLLGKWYYQDGTVRVKPSQGPRTTTKEDIEVYLAIAFTLDQNLAKVDKIEINFKEFEPGTTALTGSCWTSVAPNVEGLTLS